MAEGKPWLGSEVENTQAVKVEGDLASLLDLNGETELENLVHIVQCLCQQPNIVVLKYEIHIKVDKGEATHPNQLDQDNYYVIRQGDFDGDPLRQNSEYVWSGNMNNAPEKLPKEPNCHNSFSVNGKTSQGQSEIKNGNMNNILHPLAKGFVEKRTDVNESATTTLTHSDIMNGHTTKVHSQFKDKEMPAEEVMPKKEEKRLTDEDDEKPNVGNDLEPVTDNVDKVEDRVSQTNQSQDGFLENDHFEQQQPFDKAEEKAYKCFHCHQSFEHLLTLQIHELCHPVAGPKSSSTVTRSRQSKRPYRCPSCKFKHFAKCHIESHLTEVHNYARFFICKICKFVCITSSDYSTHMSSKQHHDTEIALKNEKGTHLCPVCAFRAKSATVLNTHMVVHAKDKNYSCSHCSFRCKTALRLKNHEELHKSEKRFQCDLCTFSTHIKHHLKRHMETHSRNYLKYKCRQCNAAFQNMHKLKDHAMLEHDCPDFYYCAHCLFSCQDRKLYSDHMQLHRGKNQYACDKCEYTTNKKHQLEAHKLTHSDVKPFSCHICHTAFAGQLHLRKHMVIHQPKKPQYFPCRICSFTAKNKRLLNNHMRSHLNFNSHKCSQCDYSTKYRGNLYKHQLKHLDDKPQTCNLCDFACKLPESLRRHKLRVHKYEIFQTTPGKPEIENEIVQSLA